MKKWKRIKKATHCSKEEAKTLKAHLALLPKLEPIFYDHLKEINLRSCRDVEVLRSSGCDDRARIRGHKYSSDGQYLGLVVYIISSWENQPKFQVRVY